MSIEFSRHFKMKDTTTLASDYHDNHDNDHDNDHARALTIFILFILL